jgi:hypothetical protein
MLLEEKKFVMLGWWFVIQQNNKEQGIINHHRTTPRIYFRKRKAHPMEIGNSLFLVVLLNRQARSSDRREPKLINFSPYLHINLLYATKTYPASAYRYFI